MNIQPEVLEYLKEISVLYVDDDKVILSYVSMIIGRRAKEILTAENGLEGVERVKQNPHIDIILTDLNMPEMNGQEMIEEIRKTHPDLPVVAITAFDEDYDLSDFDAVIIKPFEPKQMIDIIAQTLKFDLV